MNPLVFKLYPIDPIQKETNFNASQEQTKIERW